MAFRMVDLSKSIDEIANINMFGFGKGRLPEKILSAAKNSEGELMFLVRWTGETSPENPSIVPAKAANVLCPQVVIKYYEDRLMCGSLETKKDLEMASEKEPTRKSQRLQEKKEKMLTKK